MLFCSDNECSGVYGVYVIPRGERMRQNQRVYRVSRAFPRITQRFVGIAKVLEYLRKYPLPSHFGRQDAFHILHYEDCRVPLLDDAKVFLVEEMAMIILGSISSIAEIAGSPCKRVSLAWRSTNQNPRAGRIQP